MKGVNGVPSSGRLRHSWEKKIKEEEKRLKKTLQKE